MKKGRKYTLSCMAISAVVMSGININQVNASDQVSQNISKIDQMDNQTNLNLTENGSGPVSSLAQSKVTNPEVQNGGHVSDDFPNINNDLSYASKFHIFANEATLGAHVNGNVAVGTLYGNVNFGTNITELKGLDKDISYVENVEKMANSSFVSANDDRTNKVIFGTNNTIVLGEDNGSPMVNGTKIDHLTNDEIFQDKEPAKYLDFAEEFAKLEGNSSQFSNLDSKTITNADFPDINDRTIDLSDYQPNSSNQIVINLDPEVLNANTPLKILGLKDGSGPEVIINVDTKGASNYQMNSQIKLLFVDENGNVTDRPNQETEYFDDNRILWNFYDSSASDNLYSGTIEMNNTFQGSVLAPAATIEIHHNLDGNIIADNVKVLGGETHRWDLQDRDTDDSPITSPNVDLLPVPGPVPGTDVDGSTDPDPDTNVSVPSEPDTDDKEEGTSIVDPIDGGTDSSDANDGSLMNLATNSADPADDVAESNETSSGLLPQTGAAANILASVVGLLLILGFATRKFLFKKNN